LNSNNGHQEARPHRVVIYAESDDGKDFSEQELRQIEQYLEQRGFSGNINIVRPSFLEKIGSRIFG